MTPEEIRARDDYRYDQESLAHSIDMAYRELQNVKGHVLRGVKLPAIHKERMKTIVELLQEIIERNPLEVE